MGKNLLTPNEKFLLMILCSQAKLENDNKSVNVKRGLRTRIEMGLWPGIAPTGYLNEKRLDRKCQVIIDPQRATIIKQMFEKYAYDGWSGRKLYHWLKFEINFRTIYEHPLSLSNIYRILRNHFYYGILEYPKSSGNFYTGKQEPIITRELFIAAQAQLKKDNITHSESKEFAFTKLMICGLCGSGITAQEKFKKLKTNGLTARYVYYGCSRAKDLHCKNTYIREEELIKQFIELIGQMDINDNEIKKKFEIEMKRIKEFQKTFLGNKITDQNIEFDPRSYATYVLQEGTIAEKRELLGCLKNRLILTNKIVKIEKGDGKPSDNMV